MGKRNYDVVIRNMFCNKMHDYLSLVQAVEIGSKRFIIIAKLFNADWNIEVWDEDKTTKSIFSTNKAEQYNTENIDWFFNNRSPLFIDKNGVKHSRSNYTFCYYVQKKVCIFRKHFLPLFLTMRDNCILLTGL